MTLYAARDCRRPIRMSLLCQIDMTLPRIFREVSGVTVRLMSDKELARLEGLRDLDQRRLTPAAAAQLLGLERRQVFRLLKVYRTEGAAGLISKRRGRPSNRRQPAELRAEVLAIIRERYWDFGPTLAAEKQSELHGIALGRETLRQWMIADGLWVDRKQRLKRVHQPRSRRECVGELVQIEGCEHWWFEDRGPQCTLLVFVDDATGRVERAHKTLQDRLVKELRLAGASSLAEGNALLPPFMADYNARFAKPPANSKDLHRPLRDDDHLENAFAWKEERTLSRALTLQYDKVVFVLAPTDQAKAAIGKRVSVLDYPDGRLSIRYKGVELAYRTFDKLRQGSQAEIVENKRPGAVLAVIREQQIARVEPRSKKAPRRRDQSDARLFKVG